jgi:predicted HicB family RNase H-like nuclease
MKYKGYIGQVTYDDDAKIFHGEVLGLKDVITFQGESVKELEQAFKDSINDYLEFCHERGEGPEKTFSGNIRVRMDAIAACSNCA